VIARLRRRHRRTWLVLGVLLPVIAFLAWRTRRPAAVMDELPAELREEGRR
jgi:hypothetical protein